MQDAPFWTQPTAALVAAIGSPPDGLAGAEAARRLAQHGPNDAGATRRRSAWHGLAVRLGNPLVLILLAASALSATAGDVTSFAIVTGIVGLSMLLDMVQESRAHAAVDALQARVAVRAQVLRDGVEQAVPVAGLVPGDRVRLSAGDLVPADGRLLEARDFFVNEALLTGESYPVEKQAIAIPAPAEECIGAPAAVLAGTSVISGHAVLLVCATGRHTALGGLAAMLVARAPPTSFERGLRRFSALILRVTMVLVVVVLAGSLWFQRPWLDSVLFALALAVGLTPELLPMIVTVTLARGAVRLARRRAIVKRLPAIHNLGAMDVLCTDKTGTLTEAKIQLVRCVDAAGQDSRRAFEMAWLNSHFETGLKSPLDEAILRHETVDAAAWRKLDEVPFDFERRRVSVLVERGGERLLVVKGAPEDVLALSSAAETPDGGTRPLDAAGRAALHAAFEAFGAEGCRALAVACRTTAPDHATAVVTDEAALVFVGFAVFLDPPKQSAAAAIHALARDGVAVKILTGDNERVAVHLCAQLGIRVSGVLTGDALHSLSDEALRARLRRTSLFCRVTPQQKLRVLLALKHGGQTVGFLGDGINDAPALHAADVGISVDSAADVAKSAADIVLLEQDLGVLHEGVVEGRRTVANVSKYILMAGSSNFGNMVSMALAGLMLPFLPMLPTQVLLNNLLYEATQMALPLDRVDREAIARPVHWDIRLIERFMLVMGPLSSVFDLLTFAVLLYVFHADIAQFRTGWFVESMATQTLVIFAVRTRRRFFASFPHPAVAVLAVGAAAAAVALPFLAVGRWFGFVALGWDFHLFVLATVVLYLAAVEAIKPYFYARLAPGPLASARRPGLSAGSRESGGETRGTGRSE